MQINFQGNRFHANNTNHFLKNIVTGQLQQSKQQEQNEQNKILALLDVTSAMSGHPSEKKTLLTYFKPIRLSGDPKMFDHYITYEAKFGGAYEYTEEDAYHRLTTPSFTMDDAFLEQMGIDSSQRAADDTSLENGLSVSEDYFWADLDCSTAALNTEQLEQSVDYLASRYAVMKDRIEKESYGDEGTARLDELDRMMNKQKEKLAQKFADEVGAIFEENGVRGEKERLYQSVLAQMHQQTEAYTNFIKKNQDFANINSEEKAWLSKDSAYLASALRKAMQSADPSPGKESADSNLYTIDEMKKMQIFAKELASYTESSFDLNGRTEKAISLSDNEEALGMKLAELTLKGKIFKERAGVSAQLQQTITTAIGNFTERAMDHLQAYFDKYTKLQIEATEQLWNEGGCTRREADSNIAEIKKYFSPVDKQAVYAVINQVQEVYQQTGNATRALIDGAVAARRTYYSKTQNEDYTGMGRYQGKSVNWNSFFQNKDTVYGESSYILKDAVFNSTIHSWNDFMGKFTADKTVLLNLSQFSAWA